MKSKAYQASPADQSNRRSIYMFAKRSLAVPLMTVFDYCDTTAPAGKRDVTIVAPQALTLFNNDTIHAESRAIADRVMASTQDQSERTITAWRLVLGRDPSADEAELAKSHLSRLMAREDGTDSAIRAWSSLCHVLLNSNEFMFVD